MILCVSANSSEKVRWSDVDVAGSALFVVDGGACVALNGGRCELVPVPDALSTLGLGGTGDGTPRSPPLSGSRSPRELPDHRLSDSSSPSKLDRRCRARKRPSARACRRSDALSDMRELEDGMDAHEGWGRVWRSCEGWLALTAVVMGAGPLDLSGARGGKGSICHEYYSVYKRTGLRRTHLQWRYIGTSRVLGRVMDRFGLGRIRQC